MKLNQHTFLAVLTAIVSLAVAFGAPLTQAQSNSILVLGGAVSVVFFAHGLTHVLNYLSPQTLAALVTAVIGTAVAFGLPITQAQTTQILNFTGVIAGLLLVHGTVHTVARAWRRPSTLHEPESHVSS